MSSRLRLSSSARLAQSWPGRLISGVCDEAKPATILAIQATPLLRWVSIGRVQFGTISSESNVGSRLHSRFLHTGTLMAFIEVLGLGYSLPGKRLLFSDVEFKVASGQRVALIGGNGVGKSTVLRIIAGEDDEYLGTARVEGTLLFMRQFVARAGTTVRQLLRG